MTAYLSTKTDFIPLRWECCNIYFSWSSYRGEAVPQVLVDGITISELLKILNDSLLEFTIFQCGIDHEQYWGTLKWQNSSHSKNTAKGCSHIVPLTEPNSVLQECFQTWTFSALKMDLDQWPSNCTQAPWTQTPRLLEEVMRKSHLEIKVRINVHHWQWMHGGGTARLAS